MISYQGGRFVSGRVPRTGQFLDRTAGGTFDVALEAGDTLVDRMRGWLGWESRQMRAAADRQKLLESYRRSLQEGRIALRKGWTFEDLETFVNADDLETIFDLVVDKSPAKTRQQDEARARAEQEKVRRQAALPRQQEEERLAAERTRADQERAQRAAVLVRQSEEATAAERARLEREGAAREQAAQQQQAARAAADGYCGRKKAALSGFNPSTGSYRCNCPQGMVVGVGDICVSQHDLAVANCAKQNADLQSLDRSAGKPYASAGAAWFIIWPRALASRRKRGARKMLVSARPISQTLFLRDMSRAGRAVSVRRAGSGMARTRSAAWPRPVRQAHSWSQVIGASQGELMRRLSAAI